MPIAKIIDNTRNAIKIWTNDIESSAEDQLRQLGSLPFIFRHIAVMPDVHSGKGTTIGCVFASKDHLIPAAVGVDIGCGMTAVKLSGIGPKHVKGKEKLLRMAIESVVPVGFSVHADQTGLKALPKQPKQSLLKKLVEIEHRAITTKSKKLLRGLGKFSEQIGSLGGGNHFIELCWSTKGEMWLLLHSGSRGVGNLLAQHHIDSAKGLMLRSMATLPNPDLAFLVKGEPEFENYLHDMMWAQDFAYWNRRVMQSLILRAIGRHLPIIGDPEQIPFIDCHHNYVAIEDHFGEHVHVTRKGAVRAQKGDYGIIPGSMGAKSYIVRGKGEPQSFHSCSHGAGRKMSRTQAKKTYNIDDLMRQTKGVECRIDGAIVDEIPAAYKDIDTVIQEQSDLVEVVEELRQFVCVKG